MESCPLMTPRKSFKTEGSPQKNFPLPSFTKKRNRKKVALPEPKMFTTQSGFHPESPNLHPGRRLAVARSSLSLTTEILLLAVQWKPWTSWGPLDLPQGMGHYPPKRMTRPQMPFGTWHCAGLVGNSEVRWFPECSMMLRGCDLWSPYLDSLTQEC